MADPLSDESGITSLTTLREVGQAVTLHKLGVKDVLVGRITHFAGDPFDGLYPVIHARTPHGTDFWGGRVWLRPPTPSEMDKLAAFEADALRKGHPERYWWEDTWTERN